MRVLIILSIIFISLVSCSKDQDITIRQYLDENNIDAIHHSSGIYYLIEVEGTGKHPEQTDDVVTHYKGYYLDGEEFDSSLNGSPIQFNLKKVIKGWTIGIPLLKEGGKGKLFIPPHLAYGSYPPSGIRKDASLVFDIELIEIK